MKGYCSKHTVQLMLFYAFAFALFFAIEWPDATMGIDDYHYAFICTDDTYLDLWEPFAPRQRVETIGDIFVSQWNHYRFMNGRFIVHFLVQLFIAKLGYTAFALFVALLSVVAVEMAARIVAGSDRPTIAARVGVMVIMFAVLPFFDLFMTWFGSVAFSLNYVLPSAAWLAVLWYFMRNRFRKGTATWWKAAGLLIAGFAVGELHEGFSVPILGAMLIYAALRWRRVGSRVWLLLAGLAAGTAVVAIGAAINREPLAVEEGLWMNLRTRIFDLYSIDQVLVPIILASIFWLVCYAVKAARAKAVAVARRGAVYGLAGVLSFLFCFFVVFKFGFARSMMPAGLMIVLLVAMLLREVVKFPTSRAKRSVTIGAAALLAVFAAWQYAIGMERRGIHEEREREYVESDSGYVHIPDPMIYRSSNVHLNGPMTPQPFNIYSFNFWEGLKISGYHSDNYKPLVYVPQLDEIDERDKVSDDGHVRVYTRPDVWWIIIEGYNEKIDAITAADYEPRRPFHRLFERLLPLRQQEPTVLMWNYATIGGRRVVVASRRENLTMPTIMIRTGERRSWYHLEPKK